MVPFSDCFSQGYECGTFAGRTNQDAVASVKWQSHTTPPKTVVVTRLRSSAESSDSAIYVQPILWMIGSTEAWMRFRNNLTNSWAVDYTIQFCWLAIWD